MDSKFEVGDVVLAVRKGGTGKFRIGIVTEVTEKGYKLRSSYKDDAEGVLWETAKNVITRVYAIEGVDTSVALD